MKKRLIATLLALLICTTFLTANASAAAERFTDVKPSAWYYTAVDYAVSEGLFSGTSSNTFSPGSAMTRGMFVRVLGNKAKINASAYTTSSFSDVKAGTWYTSYVEWAAQNNIVSGIGGGKFAPEKSVTREQMAVILYNYARYTGCDLLSRAGALVRFSDSDKISNYAWHPMEWAVTHNILSGSGGKLDPKGTATRAQVAQIFYNSRELLVNSSEEPQPPTPSPSPDATPSPSPSPDTDTPRIPITDEVRAKLKPNQDPEKILDYVLNGKHDDPTFPLDGTKAVWDPMLSSSDGNGIVYAGCWEDSEDEMRSSLMVANIFVERMTRTGSDRFYITAEDTDGCFCLYYHPADKPDSQKMQAVKAAVNLPGSKKFDRTLLYEDAGWAGPMEWGAYNGAGGIAKKIKYYLLKFHPYTTRYYLSEPEPGVFYLFYGQ